MAKTVQGLGSIESGKQFILTIIGLVPPGVADQEIATTALSQISMTLNLSQLVRGSTVQVVQESPEALASRLGMIGPKLV